MTELEKAASGLLYDDSNDPEIKRVHSKCSALMKKLNEADPNDKSLVRSIFTQLVGKVGNNLRLGLPFYCGFGFNIEIGNNFISNRNVMILDNAKVTIGDNVFIGPNVSIYTAEHPVDFPTRNLDLEYAEPITIGDNVWIGGDCVIIAGVTIGSGSVIGAGSVVVKDIPPNCLAVGNPCRPVRKINQVRLPIAKEA